MLREIMVADEATYSSAGQRLLDLKPINFIFGTNGSGKTTISRVIADPEGHPACELTWVNGLQVERLVYNSDFTDQNYDSKMPGIFTLGHERLIPWRRLKPRGKKSAPSSETSLALRT